MQPDGPPLAVTDERETELSGWLDLVEPTEAELDLASRLTGLRIPRRPELEEIENSSRMSTENDVFYLSMPLVRRVDDNTFVTPIGLVLSRDRLITVRYTDFSVFKTVAEHVERYDTDCAADHVMVMLFEAMIDRLADLLERMGAELDRLSRRIFRSERKRGDADSKLRSQLRHVGRAEGLVSDIRESPARSRSDRALCGRAWWRRPACGDVCPADQLQAGYRQSQRLYRGRQRQDPFPARRHTRLHQHRAEQRHPVCSPWSA